MQLDHTLAKAQPVLKKIQLLMDFLGRADAQLFFIHAGNASEFALASETHNSLILHV
jgi:hypothetical protein